MERPELKIIKTKLAGHPLFTVYVTKYALTTGIYKAEVYRSDTPEWVRTFPKGLAVPHFFRLGVDAFLTFPEAQDRARALAVRRIKALEQKLSELKLLSREPRVMKAAK